MSKDGRYRKTFCSLWHHPGLRSLTPDDQRLAFYLLTGPQTNRIGIYVLVIAMAAEDLGLDPDTLPARVQHICQTFDWAFDPVARVFFIPSWWRWNPPTNRNVLAGALRDLTDVPSCELVDKFIAHTELLDRNLRETFRVTLRQRSRNVGLTFANQSPTTATATATATANSSSRKNLRASRARRPRLRTDDDGRPDDHVVVIALEVINQIGLGHPDVPEGVKSLCAIRGVPYDSASVSKGIAIASVRKLKARVGQGERTEP